MKAVHFKILMDALPCEIRGASLDLRNMEAGGQKTASQAVTRVTHGDTLLFQCVTHCYIFIINAILSSDDTMTLKYTEKSIREKEKREKKNKKKRDVYKEF